MPFGSPAPRRVVVIKHEGCPGCGAAGRTFTPLQQAPQTAAGLQAAGRADLVMQTRGSRFAKFQEVRIQELANEVLSPPALPAAPLPAWVALRQLRVRLWLDLCRIRPPAQPSMWVFS